MEKKEVFNKEALAEQVRNSQRVAFYALLEAAMRYREGFWREDVETYKQAHLDQLEATIASAKKNNKELQASFVKGELRKITAKSLDFKLRQEKLNKAMYGAIEDLEKQFTPSSKDAFDRYAAAFGDLVEELLKTDNISGLIEHCRAYNAFKRHTLVNMEPEEVISDGDHLNTGRNNVGEESVEFVVKGGNND